MNIVRLKKTLHEKIDSIDNPALLEAIYTLLNLESGKVNYALSQDQLEELDKRLELHDSGKMKYYTADQMRKKVTG